MKKQIEDMNYPELIEGVVEMNEGLLVYMKHIRRYYPEVHNKTVTTKTFREANKEKE